MNKFKVGDRVKCNGSYSFDPCEGIIIKINANESLITVEVDSKDPRISNFYPYYSKDKLELIKPAKPVKPEQPKIFIVSWEVKGCGDPQERFVTFTEADRKARELGKDENIVEGSIDIVEIKNRWEVKSAITVKISKVK